MIELSWLVFLLIAIFLSIAIYWVSWRWSHRRMLELAASVPGPPSLPIFGNSLVFMANPEEILDIIHRYFQVYGEYIKFWLGPELNIVVKDPTDIRLLLTSNKVNQKGPLYDSMKMIVGPGILSGGTTWRSHRKLVTRTYNKKSLKHFTKVMNEEAHDLVVKLTQKKQCETFDIYFDIVHTTTQSVCQTLLGLSKKDSLNINRMDELVKETQNMYSFIFKKMTRWWYRIPIIYYIIGAKKKEDYFIKLVDDMTSDMFRKRRKALDLDDKDDATIGAIDTYILSGELSEKEIKWETMTIFTTSQEASAKIASAVLLFLAYLPEWQEKVYSEIMDSFVTNIDNWTDEDVKQLKNLDLVFKEVLRYLSIAALIQRTVEEEVAINNGKIILPVGTSLVIPVHQLHRDPQYWEQPNKVKPERFLPENCKKRHPNAFVPFSLGPMDCLGRHFGTTLVKIIVVHVIRQFHLEADGVLEDLELHVAISVKFAKGYNLRVKKRNA